MMCSKKQGLYLWVTNILWLGCSHPICPGIVNHRLNGGVAVRTFMLPNRVSAVFESSFAEGKPPALGLATPHSNRNIWKRFAQIVNELLRCWPIVQKTLPKSAI